MNVIKRLLRIDTLTLATAVLALFLVLNEGAREAVASALQEALPANSTILNYSTTKAALDIDDRGVGGNIVMVKRMRTPVVWVDTNGVLRVWGPVVASVLHTPTATPTNTPTNTPTPTITPTPTNTPTATP